MSDKSEILVVTNAKVQTEHGIKRGDKLEESTAYEIARKINESNKGRATIVCGKLKVKDLIIG